MINIKQKFWEECYLTNKPCLSPLTCKYSYERIFTYVSDILDKKCSSYVTDLGCGNGELLLNIAKKYPKNNFVGIDFSENAIKNAKEKCKLSNVEFIKGDVDEVIETLEDSDLFTAINLLQDMPEPFETIKKIRSKTKNYGYFIFTAAGEGAKRIFNSLINYDRNLPYLKADFGGGRYWEQYLFPYNEVKDILINNGFEIIKQEKLPVDVSTFEIVIETTKESMPLFSKKIKNMIPEMKYAQKKDILSGPTVDFYLAQAKTIT